MSRSSNPRTSPRVILREARRLLGRRRRLQADYEHAQWWVTDLATGAQWSVSDSEPGPFCFEPVAQGEGVLIMANKLLRVADLPDLQDSTAHKDARGRTYYVLNNNPRLRCEHCGGEYSAHRGDYFAADPHTPMTCCDRPLRLVRKRTVYEEIGT